MAAIRQEPTVLAPRRPLAGVAGRVAFAAAASVATVAVVGWIGMQDRASPAGPSIAQPAPAETLPASARNEEIVLASDYVVVHRQMPNADFYRPVSASAVGGR
jgi:hypothetical protein